MSALVFFLAAQIGAGPERVINAFPTRQSCLAASAEMARIAPRGAGARLVCGPEQAGYVAAPPQMLLWVALGPNGQAIAGGAPVPPGVDCARLAAAAQIRLSWQGIRYRAVCTSG